MNATEHSLGDVSKRMGRADREDEIKAIMPSERMSEDQVHYQLM